MNNKKFVKNTKGYKVFTPDGYKDFSGVASMGKKNILKIFFEKDKWLRCSEGHRLFDTNGEEILAKNLKKNDLILGLHGPVKIFNIIVDGIEETYDLIDVDGHKYFTNEILSHNCQFISFEETLIDPHVLRGMQGIEPIELEGRVRWYSPILPNRIYIVGLDPSMGTGGDNAAITVWMLPEFKQVAEWIHNRTDIKGQMRVMMDILSRIHKELKEQNDSKSRPEIYWSVENNSIGEAALQVIESTGEDYFPGYFVHEPKKKRKGFTTTHKTKIEACARLKSLVESGRMEVLSKPLTTELKAFVRSNRSFEAKDTERDDIVLSTLLCMRVLNEVQNYDENTYNKLAEIIELEDEEHDPMPLIVA